MSSNRSGPFPNLDAFRAIGMLMVMTNHAAFSANLRAKAPTLNAFIARFDISIPVFFMVSGFLLFRPFAASVLGPRPFPSLREYSRNRALRVFPAYWAAMIGVFLWFGLPTVSGAGPFDHHPAGPVVFYALLLQTFDAKAVFNGYDVFDQAWSIGTEVVFYIVLPLIALGLFRWANRRDPDRLDPQRRRRQLLWACAGLIAVAQVWRVGIVVAEPTWQASAAFWLPAHIDFFALGMAMAAWSAGHSQGLALPRPIEWLSRRPWTCWAVAGALWLVVVNPTGALDLFTIKPSPLVFTNEYVAKQAMYVLVGFFYLLPAVFGPQREGSLRRFLGSAPMAALGTVSLGFYLWHKAWLVQAERWTGARAFQGSFITLWLVSLAGGLACGVASYWLVERPFLRRKRPAVSSTSSPATVTSRPEPVP